MSTERRGLVSVGSGFIEPRTTSGSPVVIPPSSPPQRFVSRWSPRSSSQKISSWAWDPGSPATSIPSPIATALIAWIDRIACPSRPFSRSSPETPPPLYPAADPARLDRRDQQDRLPEPPVQPLLPRDVRAESRDDPERPHLEHAAKRLVLLPQPVDLR